MHVVTNSHLEREIWNERGRWLGTEERVDELFFPFTDGKTAIIRNITMTAAFSDQAEAQQWIREFDNQQAIERVAAAGGTKLVIM